MTTNEKGAYAELRAASLLARAGYTVSQPLTGHSRYDLVIEKDGEFKRVQVKARTPVSGSLRVRTESSSSSRSGVKRSGYTGKEIDYYCVIDLESEQGYLVPYKDVSECGAQFTLRIDGSKNGQEKNVRMACGYSLVGKA